VYFREIDKRNYSLFNFLSDCKYKSYFSAILISFLIAISLVLLTFATISTGSATEIIVSPNGVGANNSTINDAINHVNLIGDSNNTIILLDGVYNTTNDINNYITINGNLKIIGNSSPDNVIIDGRGIGFLFNIAPNSNVTFENISFINAVGTNGGAIYNEGNLEIINSIFENNQAINGGAIYSTGDTVVNQSKFIKNSEAIFLSGSINKIISSSIMNNDKGIFIDYTATNTVINYNRILNNTNSGYDLENHGDKTDANLNWWGKNYIDSNQVLNDNTNFSLNYWYVLQITLDNNTYLKSIALNFTKDIPDIYLAYNLSTNIPTTHNPAMLPVFNVTVLCPFNNTFVRNIQSFAISWGTGTRWGLPINQYNTYYSVQAFTDNEHVLVEMNYHPPVLKVNNLSTTTDKSTTLSAQFLAKSGQVLINKTIEFWINGVYIGSNKTNSNGIAIYNYKITKEGLSTFSALFQGDNNYSKTEINATVSVVKGVSIKKTTNDSFNKNNNTNKNNTKGNNKDNKNNNSKNNKKNNNLKSIDVQANMKKSGNPLIAILIVVLFSLFVTNRFKK